MQLYENEVAQERVLLISVDTGEFDAEISIDELEELANTAGAIVVAQMIQKREKPENATFVGKGKLAEIVAFCENNDIDLIISDSELSPSQQRNLEKITNIRVIDRTMLILDIFAQRARSSEGKLQVELAQLRYTLPRLGGQGLSMSRLGGGVGTRGPGETQLETDKRHIRRKMQKLEEDLKQMQKRRLEIQKRRDKDGVQIVAIVGYTNAGKSTLMNSLTGAGVLAENMLFATLDPTARALTLPDGRNIMLVDTVGFIRRLPHKLVEAFKSTLEQVVSATVILNICDASDEHCKDHLDVTKNLLSELGCADKPIISVMNKCDLVTDMYDMPTFGKTVMICAKESKGFDKLLDAIVGELPPTRKLVELIVPFSEGSMAAKIRNEGSVEQEQYQENGLYMKAIIDFTLIEQIKDWLI